MDPYLEEFLSPEEGAARAAVKRLTATLEQQLIEATINAPDWYGRCPYISFHTSL